MSKLPVPSASSGRLAMIAAAAEKVRAKTATPPEHEQGIQASAPHSAQAQPDKPATEAPAIEPTKIEPTAAQQLMIADGAPPELMRGPDTPAAKAARTRIRNQVVGGPDGRQIKSPRDVKGATGLGASPFQLKSAGATLKGEIQKETDMTTKANTNTKTKSGTKRQASTERRKPASKAARTPRVKATGPSGKVVDILKLTCRAKGATPEELNTLTKWKGAPWKWLFKNPKKTGYCDRWGYSFDVIKDDSGTHYKTEKKPEK